MRRSFLVPETLAKVVARDNAPSIRFARRLGCTAGEALTNKGRPCTVFDYSLEPVAKGDGFTA